MKIHISISRTNNSVVIHDGDSVDQPWRFREILAVTPDGEVVSDVPRCNKGNINAITSATFFDRFWMSHKMGPMPPFPPSGTTSPDNDDDNMDFANLQKEPIDNVSVTPKLDIQPLPTKPKPIPAAQLKSVKVKPNKLNKSNPAKFVKKITTDNSFLDDIFAEDDVIIKE